jgi:hypothetical protein
VAKYFVPILYQMPAFGAFKDFSDFVESITCGLSKTCQVRGSNPCRGATPHSPNLGVDSQAPPNPARIANNSQVVLKLASLSDAQSRKTLDG